uniref:Malate dehydrogenase n=1 Tax=Timema cristinae TaxID=61476 RepID=A0A7R9CMM1_TIMCR|nr:unnamed protein product [Timema cristinae]
MDRWEMKRQYRVTVIGAGGGIGQPLTLLLKQSPLVTQLNLYDLHHSAGVGADLSHIETPALVCCFMGLDQLKIQMSRDRSLTLSELFCEAVGLEQGQLSLVRTVEELLGWYRSLAGSHHGDHVLTDARGNALSGADIVTIVAGIPRKPGMSRDDLFSVNASIIRDVFCGIAKHCPKALVSIVTNPMADDKEINDHISVNSLVPLAAEIMDINGVFDPCRLFGVTTLDIVRANTFIADLKGLNPLDVNCPCIGGHAGPTIIPVISQCCPRVEFTELQLKELTKRVQEAGTEVVKAKEGKGSATLSTAFATARLTFAMCRGLRGDKGVVECSYVRSDVTDAKFFSTPLVLGVSKANP